MAKRARKGYEYFLENYGATSLDDLNDYLQNINSNPIKSKTYEHFQDIFKYGYTSYVSGAQFVDSLKGYEFYLKHRGNVSIDDINIYLHNINCRPIHNRTYKHYEKLLRREFSSYIPINQFDVSRTLGKLQFASDRRQYSREITQLNAKVSKDGEIWIPVNIRDKSLVGFGIETINQFSFKPYNQLFVHIDQYNEIPVIMVWKHHDNGLLRCGVRALKFIETYKIIQEDIFVSKSTELLIINKLSDKYLSWEEIYRILDKINELIHGSSELLIEIAKIADLKEYKIIQPSISSISFNSPFDIKINIDFDVAKVLNVIFSWCFLGRARKERYKEITPIFKNGLKLENDKQLLEIELRRNAINPKKETEEPNVPQDVSDSLREELKDIYRIDKLPPDLLTPGSYENGILKYQVIPAASELITGDDPDVEITIREKSIEGPEEK